MKCKLVYTLSDMMYKKSSAPSPASVDLAPLFKWITKKLAGSINDVVNLAIQELESLLRITTYRLPVWNTQNAMKE